VLCVPRQQPSASDHPIRLPARPFYRTATIHVLSGLLDAVDRGDTAALVLLDLSAAFDTVDHEILLERLRVIFGADRSALAWFRTYLAGRTQHVRCGGKCSTAIDIARIGPRTHPVHPADECRRAVRRL